MRILVTGVNGQLGYDVMRRLSSREHEGIGTDVALSEQCSVVMDITDAGAVMDQIKRIRPDCVIHCAAWTAVDDAEDPENLEKVDSINHIGTRNVAEAAKAVDASMIYISTDYVFSGNGDAPWKPDDKDFRPLNVYGTSKLAGESEVSGILEKFFIVRTAWVFGLHGSNFIKTMINVGKNREEVRVVNDQIGTPTYTWDLARLLIDMAGSDRYGYYHATNEGGYISWYDLCQEAYKQYGLNTKVIPVTTEEYGKTKAVRPHNSRLDKSKLKEAGFDLLPVWQDAVARYLKEAKL